MADTPTARNVSARWNDVRRNERSTESTPIVVIHGGAESGLSGRRPRGDQKYTTSIHHLPVPALQLDASRLRALLSGLKVRGDTDLPLAGGISQAGLFIADANDPAASLLQASSPEDLVGPANYLFAISPQTVEGLMRAWFDGTGIFSEPMRIRSFRGAVLDIRLSVTLPSPDCLDPLIVVLEDITGRRQTSEHESEQELDPLHQARLSALGRLAASIAHEVNQPLATIVTDCETTMRHLSRDEPNLAKVGELATRIAESAQRASEIVKRVRGMANGQTHTRMPLDLNDIVNDVLSFVRHELDMHGICLTLACAPALPSFLGDRIQMQQVLVNLLVNAIEAVVSSGRWPRRIEITTIEAHERLQFSIRDSGDGISTADLARIFDCFYTTKQDGGGVGLSICQSIVLDHGGDIHATNAGNGGALFRFSLPARR